MKKPDSICPCCGRALAYHMFAVGNQICNYCANMTPNDIALTTRATAERLSAYHAETAKGRKEARVLAKLDQYAVTGKRCGACHHHKPAIAYGACATRGDGLQANCKACNKLRLSIVQTGGSISMWHTVRNALRAAATGPLNEPAPVPLPDLSPNLENEPG